jgi:hypothetical protein
MVVTKVEKQLERLQQKTYRTPLYHYPGEKYAYICGVTKGGRTFFDGPYAPSDSQIDRVVSRLSDSEIFYYDTRSLDAATRQMKAELLNRGVDPDEALKKVLHKKGLEREEKQAEVKRMFGIKLW